MSYLDDKGLINILTCVVYTFDIFFKFRELKTCLVVFCLQEIYATVVEKATVILEIKKLRFHLI